ncbi:MAG: NADH:flavin oxidoreductase/NADH oxidase [Pseudazoarcus pumilus]|mgnify:CR=1 FL=1|nr:NADH:flavin oxidoreductase/NADH oxidase [Pseudazoarcus pumilus]
MSSLFSPLQLDALQLANRVVIAPMCQYSAEDGCATDWHLMHLGQLAMSGAGLLILEATAVRPEGRISPQDLGLYSDANEVALARVIGAVRKYADLPICVQLAHAGRKASSYAPWLGGSLVPAEQGGWQPLAPSPVAHGRDEPPPAELTEADLNAIRDAFVVSAQRAARLGLDAIELHGAHGYLLHQFLSPLSNLRTDAYGGSLENRMRFPLEVFDAVRAVFPAGKPVGMRISASDWVEGGWDVAQSLEFAAALEARGCAFIHVSSGGLSVEQKIPLGPGYQVPFARQVRKHVKMPVIAVGLLTEPEQAEAILADGDADAVALARGMLWDPRWPWHAAAKLGGTVKAPPQYWRCEPREFKGVFGDTTTGQR